MQDIKRAWANAVTPEQRKKVAPAIQKIFEDGYFKSNGRMKNDWKFRLEQEVLDKFGIEYLPEWSNSEDVTGCFARQASRSRSDVKKRAQELGRRRHGYIISGKAPKGHKEEYKRIKSLEPDAVIYRLSEGWMPNDKVEVNNEVVVDNTKEEEEEEDNTYEDNTYEDKVDKEEELARASPS